MFFLVKLVVSKEKVFSNWTPRNKNRLWRPFLITNREKINNLYKGPFNKCFLTKFRFIWPSGFRGEFFLKIDQPETRIAYVWGHCGRDRIAVGFTTMCAISITTKVVSLNPVHGEVHTIQHYVIKFVSDLWQVWQ